MIVYRIGAYIPIPGIDPAVFAQVFDRQANGIFGMFNMFSGGALRRMAIFALNVMPYISASIIVQLWARSIRLGKSCEEGGEAGPQAAQPIHPLSHRAAGRFQASGIAIGLQNSRRRVVDLGPAFFRAHHRGHPDRRHHVPDVAGRADHRRGVGNGVSLIIFAGIVARLPTALSSSCRWRAPARWRRRAAVHPVMAVAVIVFIVFMERAQRRIARAISQAPGRQPDVRRRDLASCR